VASKAAPLVGGLLLLIIASGASAGYKICQSKIDGAEYLACRGDCSTGDRLVSWHPGTHPKCPAGNTGADCGQHWSGWIDVGYGPGNPCPAGCSRGNGVGEAFRFKTPFQPQWKYKFQCWGTPLTPDPPKKKGPESQCIPGAVYSRMGCEGSYMKDGVWHAAP